MSRGSNRRVTGSPTYAASVATGNGWVGWLLAGYPHRMCYILGRRNALSPVIRDKSRMRQSAHVRIRAGVPGDLYSYRDRYPALRGAQEAVIHVVRVKVVSRNRPDRLLLGGESALAGTGARLRSVERRDGAVLRAQEAMAHTVRVDDISVNRPGCVYILRLCALAGASACPRNVKRGDRAICSARKAVVHTIRVNVESWNRPPWVDPCGNGTLESAGARPGTSKVVMVPWESRT